MISWLDMPYVMGNGIKPSKYFAKSIASLDYQVKLPHIWS